MNIRPISFSELSFAYKLTEMEEWGTSLFELTEIFYSIKHGFFIGEQNENSIGIISAMNYGLFGFIGNLIVLESYRGQGYGKKLLNYAIRFLLKNNVETIFLDAVPEYLSLYQQFKFKPICKSLRLERTRGNLDESNSVDILGLDKITFDNLAKFDQKYFGGDRKSILKSRYDKYSKFGRVSVNGDNIEGYLMSFPKKDNIYIGPWIMFHEQINGVKLLSSILEAKKSDKFTIGVLENNKIALEILRSFKFTQYSYSIRMRYGKKRSLSNVIYGIAGPDRG
jgi:ribosomal protein S18 acetylase RimI-like enzyme